MHKKLEAELVKLAHSILQMKNKEDVSALHIRARDIYEKLSVLKFVDAYVKTSPDSSDGDEEIVHKIEDILNDEANQEIRELIETIEEEAEEKLPAEAQVEEIIEEEAEEQQPSEEQIEEVIEEEAEEQLPAETKVEQITEEEAEEQLPTETKVENIIEEETEEQQPAEALVEKVIEQEDTMIKDEVEDTSSFQTSLEEEFKDAISADVATKLFEKVTKENPVVEQQSESKKQTLNEALFKNNLQIGLNDRIAFVKHLFDGSQEDFNRVISQLNSFKSEKEAKNFINKLVKPDYDWSIKEEYEQRLFDLIERKFL